jgi:hypothetical protein
VQEVLWLLETVDGLPEYRDEYRTVQGKYLNKIVDDLRRRNQGTTLNQILTWITTLHVICPRPQAAASGMARISTAPPIRRPICRVCDLILGDGISPDNLLNRILLCGC